MKIPQKILDLVPRNYITEPKHLNRLGDIISRPAQNRIIMGATALLTQPAIDYFNPKVDKKTAKTSRNRTIGKIVAGTAVGCVVRKYCFDLVNKHSDKVDLGHYTSQNYLFPRFLANCQGALLKNKMRNYKIAFATTLALAMMVFTNVLIDMPLTTMISNGLNKLDSKLEARSAKRKAKQNVNGGNS